MEILNSLVLAVGFSNISNILIAALSLGLVIFFHELGHFAVAKWCDVNVERFSIGFGPVLWSWKRGETEYAVSLIPFGGYVKMLGQDDMDPSQLSSEEIAMDPRSYSAKPVHQRMAIISAGVIMNVITGLAFFAIAFGMGVSTPPAILGGVQVAMPAWEAGLEPGDTITRINGRDVNSFGDIIRGTALSTGPLEMEGLHRDQETFKTTVYPDVSGTRPKIGVEPTLGLELIDPSAESGISALVPGSPAANATPSFQPGDTIKKIGETSIESFAQLQELLARKRSETLDFYVQRKNGSPDELFKITVEPNYFRTLGLWMDIGQITAIRKDSPAAIAGLKIGDKITNVNGRDIGKDINPLELPDYLSSLHGQEVELKVKRQVKGAAATTLDLSVVPEDRLGWISRPTTTDAPVAIDSIGAAFHLIASVTKVVEGSPAAQAGLVPGDRIKRMKLVLPQGAPADSFDDESVEISFDKEEQNWAFAFWLMQSTPNRNAELTVSTNGKEHEVELVPRQDKEAGWCVPTRGIRLVVRADIQQANGVAQAVTMGVSHTYHSMLDIYLTLRNLFGRTLSVKELHGPLGIAAVAYQAAQQGIPELLLFLGFLSVNLAVLNFLPIPVLDGGHMVFLVWEAVTRRRPSEKVLIAATYCGMAFVLGLIGLVLYLDLFVHRLGVN